jgi:hypothetical protein
MGSGPAFRPFSHLNQANRGVRAQVLNYGISDLIDHIP